MNWMDVGLQKKILAISSVLMVLLAFICVMATTGLSGIVKDGGEVA